jgi:hypothetical protein
VSQSKYAALNLRGGLESCLTFVAVGKTDGQEAPALEAPDWAVSALAVFQSFSQFDRLIHGMFNAGSQAPAPAAAARAALAKLAEIEANLHLLESRIDRITADI